MRCKIGRNFPKFYYFSNKIQRLSEMKKKEKKKKKKRKKKNLIYSLHLKKNSMKLKKNIPETPLQFITCDYK